MGKRREFMYVCRRRHSESRIQLLFFWAGGDNLQNDESRLRRVKSERKTVSDFYWLKAPPAPSIAPGAGISFERFPRPWQTVGSKSGPSKGEGPDLGCLRLSLFLKRWVPLPELHRLWFACTGASDEQTRPGSEPWPSAHGLNPRHYLRLRS